MMNDYDDFDIHRYFHFHFQVFDYLNLNLNLNENLRHLKDFHRYSMNHYFHHLLFHLGKEKESESEQRKVSWFLPVDVGGKRCESILIVIFGKSSGQLTVRIELITKETKLDQVHLDVK